MTYTLGDVVARLETLRGLKLTDEEQNSVEYWHKGQQLRFTMSTEGWKTVLDLLQGYVVKAVEDLVKVHPGTNDVPAAHCIAFVANSIFEIFQKDVRQISNREQPTVVKETIQSQAPLEEPL